MFLDDNVGTLLKFAPSSPIFTPFGGKTVDMFHHVTVIAGKINYILCVFSDSVWLDE